MGIYIYTYLIVANQSIKIMNTTGPANTVTGVSRLHLFIMAFVSAVAARSMRSIEAIGSCSMVYASSFFILLLGNIFIVMFFLVFALQMYMIILTFPVCYGKKNVLIIDR